MKRKKRALFASGVAGVVALGIAIAAVSLGVAGGPPPPGMSAGVSALNTAPPVGTPVPADVERFSRVNAPGLGVQESTMISDARLLRTGLGSHGRDVYGFRVNGEICFVLTGEGGTCANPGGSSSFAWTLGGGDGITDAGALVGIAADDVTEVRLVVDGVAVPVSLANNVAYGDLPLTGKRALIIVQHRDGKTTSDAVNVTG